MAGVTRTELTVPRVLEAIPAGVIVVAADGQLLAANTKARRLLGLSASGEHGEDVVAVPPATMIREDESPLSSDDWPLGVALRTGHSQPPVTLGVRASDGVVGWVRMTVEVERASADGPVATVTATFFDVVGDAAAHRAPHAPESRLRSILENAPNMIMVADRDGTILYVNRLPSPPRTPAEIIGTSVYDYISNVDQERVRACVAGVIDTGKVASYEINSPQALGSWTFSVHVGPVRNGDAIVGVTFITWDITDRVKLQAQLMAADRLTSAGALASGVAHEINNPLTYVLANLNWIKTSLSGSSDNLDQQALRDRVASALEGVEYIRDVVRDLRSVAQDDDQERLAVDVRDTLESSLRMAQHQIEGRARVSRNFGAVPVLFASESRLGQVFVNLLVNAAQSIPAGAPDEHVIGIATRADEQGNVIIEISDSGCGIPPEQVLRVFEPFVTTKPSDVGSGLGLYVCHHIVKRMRGRIEVVDSTPRGTTFRVTLPARS